jgi:hypothetical protein
MARVTVNRLYRCFRYRLVKTAEDFGLQGEWPSTGAAGLAGHRIRARAGLKGMLKLIVTSATYRQSSKATPELLSATENRLLARDPDCLPAEMVRDQALFGCWPAGRKARWSFGKAYQPATCGKTYHGRRVLQPGQGADLYRRSLYTFWKRTVAPPDGQLDSAMRKLRGRETRTNTPLQA